MKRKTLTGLAALTLFDIVAAHAQPAVDWTGYYAGGNAGVEWADVNGSFPYGGFPAFPGPTFPVASSPYDLTPTTGVIGVQGGYNYKINRDWLVGVEADVEFGHGHASTLLNLFDPLTGSAGSAQFSATLDWSVSLRGRVGYTTGPWLLYMTGGVSFLKMSVAGSGGFNSPTGVFCADGFANCSYSAAWSYSYSEVLPGFVVGPGVEYMLPDGRWSVRAQYLFADYGNVNLGPASIVSNYNDPVGCGCTVQSITSGNVSAHVTTQTATFGLNYRLP